MLKKYSKGTFSKNLREDNNAISPAIGLLVLLIGGLIAVTAYSVYRGSRQVEQTVIYEGEVKTSEPFGSGLGDLFSDNMIIMVVIGVFFIFMITRRR